MDFLFYVPFFCTAAAGAAAAAVTEILNVCLLILSFVSAKKLISSNTD
jgi:hypothetical protein